MGWYQRQISLRPHPRGFHLVTRSVVEALPELSRIKIGMLHVFIQHTSASLTINDNADPYYRTEIASSFDAMAPERVP